MFFYVKRSISSRTASPTTHLHSQDVSREDQGSAKSNTSYTIKPHTTMPYAWDFPATRDKKILLTINNSRRVVDIMEIGDLVPFKFNVGLHKYCAGGRSHRPCRTISAPEPSHWTFVPTATSKSCALPITTQSTVCIGPVTEAIRGPSQDKTLFQAAQRLSKRYQKRLPHPYHLLLSLQGLASPWSTEEWWKWSMCPWTH